MLKIVVPATEFYDERTGEFVSTKEQTLQLEHSLVSLSKWESKWHKPFLDRQPKTDEESIDYIRCMTITQNVPENVYLALSNENLKTIRDYLDDSMTATTFSQADEKKFSRKIVTAEIIYYWMVSLQIPFECEKWHLNRLITLVRVCNNENSPKKKMGRRETAGYYRELNAARRLATKSSG